MIAKDLESKKRLVQRRLLHELTKYYEQFKVGMPMQILAAKYARGMEELGGFPEFMMELEERGLLRVELKKTGGRLVFPVSNEPDDEPIY